jgi:Na+/H+-dicarboxylate symporter
VKTPPNQLGKLKRGILDMEMDQIMTIVNEAMAAGNTAQSIVIALLVGLMMARMGQLLYFTVIALLLDLVIVPIGFSIYESEMDFSGAMDTGMELFGELAGNLSYVVVMAVFFLIALTIVSGVKSIFRRG